MMSTSQHRPPKNSLLNAVRANMTVSILALFSFSNSVLHTWWVGFVLCHFLQLCVVLLYGWVNGHSSDGSNVLTYKVADGSPGHVSLFRSLLTRAARGSCEWLKALSSIPSSLCLIEFPRQSVVCPLKQVVPRLTFLTPLHAWQPATKLTLTLYCCCFFLWQTKHSVYQQ